MSDYLRYRGRCKELAENAIQNDPSLRLVRGYYYCPIWNHKDPHWWCVTSDGTIVDPSAKQFPSKGRGTYTEFDGRIPCAECGAELDESTALFESNYAFCNGTCLMKFVGL